MGGAGRATAVPLLLLGFIIIYYYCWDLLSSAPVDMEKVWIFLLESNIRRLLLHVSCLTSKARMSQTRRSQKCALIRASTIARLVGEPTLPRKRRAPARLEVGVGAPGLFSQTAEDHF